MRKIQSLVFTVLLVLGVGAQLGAQEQVITFEFPALNRTPLYEAMIEEFQRNHPNIIVEPIPHEWKGSPQFAESLVVKAAAGLLPDIVFVPPSIVAPFADQGLFRNLEALAARDSVELDLDDVIPGTLQGALVDSQLYALPTTTLLVWTTFNADAFNEGGLPTPIEYFEQGIWNFDQVREAARKLTLRREDGTVQRWGMYFQFDVWALQGWVAGFGGEIYDRQSNTLKLNERPAIDALEFLRSMVLDDETATTSGSLSNHVRGGNLAINPWNHNVDANYRDWGAPFVFDQAPFPAGPVSGATTSAAGDVLAITSQSEHLEAAWTFAKWFSKELGTFPGQDEIVGNMPGRFSHLLDWVERRIDLGVTGARLHLTTTGDIFTPDPVPASVEATVKDALRPIWRGEQSVEQALAIATDLGNAELQR